MSCKRNIRVPIGIVFDLAANLLRCGLFDIQILETIKYIKADFSKGCMYVWVFMALITSMALCARSQDSLLSVSEHRVYIVFSTSGC